jgi:hypothetical protein
MVGSLTTSGSTGAATLVGSTLNIPIYSNALSGYLPLTGGTLTGALNGTSAVFSGDVTAFSDRRVKKNIATIDNALAMVTSLRGVTYNRIDNDDLSQKIGVIAQEVDIVAPQLVRTNADGMMSVAYANMAGLFIEAIKQLANDNDSLRQQIIELNERIN